MTTPARRLTCAAVIVAGGAGHRLGAGIPKAFCVVAGRTLLDHAASRFVDHADVRDVVIVAPASWLEQAALPGTRVVVGGILRQDSVAAGLAALAPDIDTVLIHDAARPFVPAEVITRVVDALADGAEAVIPTVPVVDTLKRVLEGVVVETVDRSALRSVQTPQGFRRATLEAAHAGSGGIEATDDAALIERGGGTVVVVEGASESFKVTHPMDLILAEALATGMKATGMKAAG
jgi:2-C-methyl-D-erythritol 4-phosphate cytidylyltransferase